MSLKPNGHKSPGLENKKSSYATKLIKKKHLHLCSNAFEITHGIIFMSFWIDSQAADDQRFGKILFFSLFKNYSTANTGCEKCGCVHSHGTEEKLIVTFIISSKNSEVQIIISKSLKNFQLMKDINKQIIFNCLNMNSVILKQQQLMILTTIANI